MSIATDASPASDRANAPSVTPSVSTERLVIVGGGMAGFGLCDRLVRSSAIDRYQVTIIGDEPRPAYDRVNLSKLFADRSIEDLTLATADWYRDHGIKLCTGRRITQINRAERTVIDQEGHSYAYDRLVLATGSYAWVPPIAGADSPNVYVYRTFQDLQQIQAMVAESGAKVGAVIGGGLLGLEAAKILMDLGLKAHVIERAPGLMPRQLDADGAHLLKDHVESLGLHVHLVRRTSRIESSQGGQLNVEFENASPLTVDLVIVAAGVRPNDQLARQSGLELGQRGGIAVADTLETSDPRIHAIGECASYRQHVYGLVAPCYRMADVLAERLAGESTRFRGADESAELKLLGVQVAVLGKAIGQSTAGVVLTQSEGSTYRKLILEQGRVVGASCVGTWDELPQVRQAIDRQSRLWPHQRIRFRKTGKPWAPGGVLPIHAWPADSVVCSCLNITRGTLSAVIEQGVTEPAMIAEQTGASTACGSCKSLVCELAGARPQEARDVPGAKLMLAASVVSALLLVAWMLAPSIKFADSVQSAWRSIDILWRSDLARQITGFTTVGLTVVGMVFSLRKRTKWFQFGTYGWWRAAHGTLGVAVLAAVAIHTGLRLGENLNFVLGVVFLLTIALGAIAGVLSGIENRVTGGTALWVRRMRPLLSRWHLWAVWPLPALIVFHVISFYWFSD
ncbi:MAG: FAD-dependent oxidoreductase [Planctomycetota bacterium]